MLGFSKTINFAGDDREFFGGCGLREFDEFLGFTGGTEVNRNEKRDVISFELGTGDQKRYFFMKRFFQPYFKDQFSVLKNHGKILSQAQSECMTAEMLLLCGIETYHPVCAGARFSFGLEWASFMVTEKIKGVCLTDFIKQQWHQLSKQRRQSILRSLANTVAKIHKNQISLPDMYLWHFFLLDSEADSAEFAVIDLHRAKKNVTEKKQFVRDMGALIFSMKEEYFYGSTKEALIDDYCQVLDLTDGVSFKRRVWKRAEKLRAKRHEPKY